jgi:hypothetical protein
VLADDRLRRAPERLLVDGVLAVAEAPKACPIGASRIAIRDSSPPIDSSRAAASSSGIASRSATSDGIARSRNGTPSRSASRGATSDPTAPYAAETVTIVIRPFFPHHRVRVT